MIACVNATLTSDFRLRHVRRQPRLRPTLQRRHLRRHRRDLLQPEILRQGQDRVRRGPGPSRLRLGRAVSFRA